MNLIFEPMSAEHERDVMDIYNYYARNTFFAYPENPLPNQFYSRFLEIGKTHPAYAIIADGEVIGFCLLRPYNPFPVFRETAEVSYFIKKEFTGRGLGGVVLKKLEESARQKGIKKLLADISSENSASIKFHLNNGFTQCGRFRNAGKKFDRHFDVVWMEKDLP